MTTILSASNFDSTTLGATAATTAQLLQQTAYNKLDATLSTGVNIGNLITNQTQLTTYGSLASTNPTDYYTFNLTGTSLKASFTNITDTTGLRYQVYNSSGKLVADNQGTTAQQTAFTQLTSAAGLSAAAGKYTIQVSYAPISLKGLPQNYGFQLYSGSTFSTSYETTAKTQTSPSQVIPVDDTQTYATADAQSYTATRYNQANATFSSAINAGWLYENKTSLAVTSQLTSFDNEDYYGFTFEKGTSIKLSFNNQTTAANATNLRVQLYNSTGTQLLADSQGTATQKAAYASLTSSTGLKANPGNYVVVVSYAPGSSQSKAQTYNFQLSSGSYYSSLDTTTASPQTIENAILSGDYQAGYSPAVALASYLDNGDGGGIISILS